ncbi:PREDICTED: uncharacterized protein LOC109154732 [Ipomoea nil]|uniref:uncharacterized protein LOC109154732 n=1 Tax=Ipomoea nil TaxID=35883 RepID=UPI000901986B|nr:PREDICTED: uncharacterized protein LOC109154732 [Ipomoea nil]
MRAGFRRGPRVVGESWLLLPDGQPREVTGRRVSDGLMVRDAAVEGENREEAEGLVVGVGKRRREELVDGGRSEGQGVDVTMSEIGRAQGLLNCQQQCGSSLMRWGGDHFHKFGEKIKRLRKRQEEIRSRRDSATLAEFQQVESQLSQLEAQEDVFWRQRAKQHWLRGADANTPIFASGVSECVDPLFDDFAPRVSLEQNNELLRPFVPEEVKTALFSMFPDKAPGPNGMNPGFYQHFWDVVGGDVSQMKPLMGDLISESQSAFIPGRLIIDNILVVAEVGHFLNRKQCGATGWGALKLDMAKAYDRMEWQFLRKMANVQEATVIKKCLNRYENLSGQKVNFHKSNICFSRNTQEAERLAVADCLQVDQAPNFGKYLGLPSFVGRNKKAAFAYVEEKIRQRIGSWNKKLLSQAGKEVLLKSVAQAMPTFTMGIFLLPDSVTLSIERTMNRYWWGSGTDRKIHWKAWDKLCVPKNYGGLGFKDLRKFNLAMLRKQGWRFLTNPNTLAAKVYKARYYPNTSFVDATIGNCPSYCWRSIMTAHDIIVSGVRRRVGNGKSTLIWGHPW